MTEDQNQKIAANYMAAVAHLLGGRSGLHDEFIRKVELILSGSEPHALQLMQFSETVRRTGRPVIWIHHPEDWNNFPQIGLVALAGEQVFMIENCVPWMRASDDRAHLIPDCYKMGAFRFDDDLRLQYFRKSPASGFKSAIKSIARAHIRLREIETVQRERGDVFTLPQLAKAA